MVTTLVMQLHDLPTGQGIAVFGAVQIRRAVEQITPMRGSRMELTAEFETVRDERGVDFRGPYVQGRRGERFVYISWGLGDDPEEFHMYRRAKIMLDEIPASLLCEPTVVASIAGTSGDGGPVCARVRAEHVEWTAG
ncbi:MAG: hypothetical protein DHS20C19_26840 [Acidimicrobiales bacterium]|nr:MAG: hypothetical protein DHS20C19_26840 [Acidimicrobiales bacterium]